MLTVGIDLLKIGKQNKKVEINTRKVGLNNDTNTKHP